MNDGQYFNLILSYFINHSIWMNLKFSNSWIIFFRYYSTRFWLC